MNALARMVLFSRITSLKKISRALYRIHVCVKVRKFKMYACFTDVDGSSISKRVLLLPVPLLLDSRPD